MESVSNSVPINYKAADVGVLTPPDHLAKYRITDAELENKFKKLYKDVYSKQKHTDFESKKKTPPLVKFVLSCVAVLLAVLGIKRIFRR